MKVKHIYLGFCGAVFIFAVLARCATASVDFTINMTHSLPGTLYVIHKGGHFVKGDLVAYRWHGGATYPAGVTFIKQVTGIPGDVVKREGHAFWVNEHFIGVAKSTSLAGVPLFPSATGAIPQDAYFMSTPNPDSLDSRYSISGNVLQSDIIGKAYALF